jgi:choline dehydrogenase-like flavoprotein
VAPVDASADIVVVGSGPAGASAAWPLVQAGRNVIMIEAGGNLDRPSWERPPLADVRGTPASFRWLFGSNLSALRRVGASSPKIRTSLAPGLIEAYTQANRVSASGFTSIGVLATGGLSNLWGAGASAFDDADLRGWPIDAADLAPSYNAVCDRIGISGSLTDDLSARHGLGLRLDPELPLGPVAEDLLKKYTNRRERLEIRLGRGRAAVLTRPRAGREACTLDSFCMWGCSKGAIYNSAQDVAAMSQAVNFRLVENMLVEEVQPDRDGWMVRGREFQGGAPKAIFAKKVLLGAGVLPSTRLALAALSRYGVDRRLHTTPSFTAAFLSPRDIGRPLPRRGFALGQLTATIPIEKDDYALGTLFQSDGVAAADIAAGMPFSTWGALRLTRRLAPAVIVGLFYLPSRYSDNTVRLVPAADGIGELAVSGNTTVEARRLIKTTMARLSKDFRRLGLMTLPGSTTVNLPGSESHYAGTLPMGSETSDVGEVIGAPGLFVVDGSVLPNLPAKHHTFTVMANADRIGRFVASAPS